MKALHTLSIVAVLLVSAGAGCTPPPEGLAAATEKAGANRGEFEKVLAHYRAAGDRRKLRAAEFLISNMPGHGFASSAVVDTQGSAVPFDARDHQNFRHALKQMEALSKKHGGVEFKMVEMRRDVETLTAEFLIENIDSAFKAWRSRPWARQVTFDAFCEYVLPYRCSQEPVGRWRKVLMAEHAGLPGKMKNPSDLREAWGLLAKAGHGAVSFNKLYYLHPTDQSFEEMRTTRRGRCEDITNMILYAARANGVPCASDYVPYWPNRDGNHNWEVGLDRTGRTAARGGYHAAKIYRKMFSIQRDALRFHVPEGTDPKTLPRWLGGVHHRDVTDQYLDTVDLTLTLDGNAPGGPPIAYLCVFNSGKWRPIHWGKVRGRTVTFRKMGREVTYLPAWYVNKKVVPAAAPFVLATDGKVHALRASDRPGDVRTIELLTKAPPKDQRAARQRPWLVAAPGKQWELFVWKGGWSSLGKRRMTAGSGATFNNVPDGGLYILIAEDSTGRERIFTLEGNGARYR